MEENREQWGSKIGFILAAIGSAIGLGNIWRFPYVVYSSGGGAFLIPYFFAIFTAGIPLLILEYGVGHKFRGSTPLSLSKINKRFEWIGWWPIISSSIILCYYSMVLSWAIKYVTLSFRKGWGEDSNSYFYNYFLKLSESPLELGGIIWPVLIGIALIWIVNWYICYKGVKSGIEKASKILLPCLLVIMIIIVIRGVTLDGAVVGLNKLFTPDWDKIKDPQIWISAYGQVFFSLSIATGIMMTYSSYLPQKTDINNSAFMTAFANCGFEFLCSIGVFSILGVMATSQGVRIEDVVTSGIGLAFIAFPKVFSLMGIWGNILGVLFFICLVFAGLTSSVSLVEAIAAAIIDKFQLKRKKVVSVMCVMGFLISTVFATNGGLYLLDIMDNFINNYGIVTVGLLESVVIGWIVKPKVIRDYTNSISYFNIGIWWDVIIKYVTPILLSLTLVKSIITEITTPYGGYDSISLLLYGWSIIVIGIIGGILISKKPWKYELKNINSKEVM
ncbi:sodium-dependent transporter [Clostridium sp. CMCC3677]|uniref:sodium-dependent transporter n=1 Tax=Clostridium sp. CMCC3677 TaxID=2949963 RepID=UPI0013F0567F|nr:sodium-dependent transporter [Clostridium sp. CMCC3677]NFG61104.1 sodium-dependent transporter [Clostridium botulinum]NFQ08850.1 sodium-dependent transporter [Clostridium botulinum]